MLKYKFAAVSCSAAEIIGHADVDVDADVDVAVDADADAFARNNKSSFD